jgi:hypothetical protein
MGKSFALVIDASIAAASSRPGVDAIPGSACREFLTAVLEICHKLVLSPELADEWRRHASSFSKTWLVQMYARRKVIRVASVVINARLVNQIESCGASERLQNEILKDLHLLTAAVSSDGLVISLETNAPALFDRHVPAIVKRFPHTWIVLSRNPASVREWLSGGRLASEVVFEYAGVRK